MQNLLTNMDYTVLAAGLVLGGSMVYIGCMLYPKWLERAMARKKENQDLAEIMSEALDNACEAGRLTKQQKLRAYRRLGQVIPDLLPKKNFEPHILREQIFGRLYKMGLKPDEIWTKLQNMRRVKPNGKAHRKIQLKPKSS